MTRVILPTRALTALALLFPTFAFAHPGHPDAGFVAGLLHPASGVDHAVAMIAIGMWSMRLGAMARHVLPALAAAFCAGMALGAAGVVPPGIEPLLAASVLALGLLVATPVRSAAAAGALLAGAFAVLHGLAHGSEMPAGAIGHATGIVLGSAVLAMVGRAAAAALGRSPLGARAAGVPIALAGLALTAVAALPLL